MDLIVHFKPKLSSSEIVAELDRNLKSGDQVLVSEGAPKGCLDTLKSYCDANSLNLLIYKCRFWSRKSAAVFDANEAMAKNADKMLVWYSDTAVCRHLLSLRYKYNLITKVIR